MDLNNQPLEIGEKYFTPFDGVEYQCTDICKNQGDNVMFKRLIDGVAFRGLEFLKENSKTTKEKFNMIKINN